MMFLKLHREEDGKAPTRINPAHVEGYDNAVIGPGPGGMVSVTEMRISGGRVVRVDETPAEIDEIINHAAGRPGVWSLERVRGDRRRVAEEMIRRSEMTRRRFEEIGIGNHLPESVPDDVNDEPFNAAAVDRALCRDDGESGECPECGGAGDVGMPLGDNADEPLACPRCGGSGLR